MNTQEGHSDDQQENENLHLQIVQLKKKLEKEEFFQKTLYRQWSELHALILAKENELKLLKSANMLYKFGFYLILFSVAPAYYFISSDKGDERIALAPQTASSSTPATHQTIAINRDTVQVTDLKHEESGMIEPNSSKPKIAAANKPVVDKPLPDSVRDFIYWEGWSAYYDKSKNPYQKASEKYEVWLKGRKDGESDSKKILVKNSVDTLIAIRSDFKESP